MQFTDVVLIKSYIVDGENADDDLYCFGWPKNTGQTYFWLLISVKTTWLWADKLLVASVSGFRGLVIGTVMSFF